MVGLIVSLLSWLSRQSRFRWSNVGSYHPGKAKRHQQGGVWQERQVQKMQADADGKYLCISWWIEFFCLMQRASVVWRYDMMWWKPAASCLSLYRKKRSVAACLVTSWPSWSWSLRSNWRPTRIWSCSWRSQKIVTRLVQRELKRLCMTQADSDVLLSSKQFSQSVFTTVFGWTSSSIETLMLSFPLNTVPLTVLFTSRPVCETTFYCCLCQALETSKAGLGGSPLWLLG